MYRIILLLKFSNVLHCLITYDVDQLFILAICILSLLSSLLTSFAYLFYFLIVAFQEVFVLFDFKDTLVWGLIPCPYQTHMHTCTQKQVTFIVWKSFCYFATILISHIKQFIEFTSLYTRFSTNFTVSSFSSSQLLYHVRKLKALTEGRKLLLSAYLDLL